jgi:hypothetical protein
MKKHINILFAIIGMLALAGCEGPLSGAKNQVSGAQGAVTVTFETPAKGARTIYPAEDDFNFTRYELTFSSDSADHDLEEVTEGSANITLPVGDWTITATAYSGKGEDKIALAQGSATVEISSGATASASITLGPVPAGEAGTLSYSVTAPPDAVGSLTVQTTTGELVTGGTIPLPTEPNTLPLPAGEYLLSVSLTKDENHAGRREVLHIYSGMTSAASYTFTEDDFIVAKTPLTAGDAVDVAATATTADVTFTGATGLTLTNDDFAVDNGASVTGVDVDSGTATVTVTFEANTETTAKTYTVSIAGSSTKITGPATVAINQAADDDLRRRLIPGSAVEVAATATTANVTFTGATDLTLTAADFVVDNGASVTGVDVDSGTATLTVTFTTNISTTASRTYTVSIAPDSTVIKGTGTVAINQSAKNSLTWTAVSDSPFTTDTIIRGVAYGDGKFVAVGDKDKIAYSSDGVSWTAVSIATSVMRGVAYGDGKFVAVGDGSKAYSTDGTTWTRGGYGGCRGVAYGYDRFVVVGNNGRIEYSTDGITWTAVSDSTFSGTQINGVAYGRFKVSNVFVAVGNNAKIAYSISYDIPAKSWGVEEAHSGLSSSYINGIAYGGGRFVAVGTKGGIGITWNGASFSGIGIHPLLSYDLNGVAHGGGKFVVVANSGKIEYSLDGGSSWTEVTSTFSTDAIYGIAYGGGKFVAVGNSGKMAYSNPQE